MYQKRGLWVVGRQQGPWQSLEIGGGTSRDGQTKSGIGCGTLATSGDWKMHGRKDQWD